MTAKQKISEYSEYFGETLLESYFHLIDMGEVKESESLRKYCEKNTVSQAASDLNSGAKSSLEILDALFG